MASASPEIAYMEARKKLRSRFRRPAIIATDFENKLANWPKIANNDAQGVREFSDFLQQVEIAMNHLHSLKILEYPSKLQTLVEKLPGWFLTKWSTKVQTLQQEKGCNAVPTFTEFVEEVTFHTDRMNIPKIFRQGAKHPAWNSLGTTSTTSLLPRRKISPPETKKEKSEDSSKDKDLCFFHKTKSHTLNECNKFQDLALDDRRDFFKKNKLLSVWLTTSIKPINAIKHLQNTTSAARDIWQHFISRPHPAVKINLIRPPKPKVPLQITRKSAERRKPAGRVLESS